MLEKIKNCVWRFLGIVWVSCMCTFLAGPRDLGGAEINGFFAFLIWLVLLVVIVKGHIVAACIISTILMFGLRMYNFGVGDYSKISDELTEILGVPIMGVILWKLFFPKHSEHKKAVPRSSKNTNMRHDYENTYNDENMYDYEADYDAHRNYGLKSGSDEYWDYVNEAEKIYNAFCAARTTDERRYYIKLGEDLKYRLTAKYGRDDESVKSILERYLDLRV